MKLDKTKYLIPKTAPNFIQFICFILFIKYSKNNSILKVYI